MFFLKNINHQTPNLEPQNCEPQRIFVFTYSFFFLTSFRRTRESQKEVKTDCQREYKSIFPEVKKFAAKGKAVTYTNRSLYTDIAELDDLFRARKFPNYFRCGKPNKHRKRS